MSACLLGMAVRYDGTDRYFDFVTRVLARRFELISICPEVELGLGVPRETIQLEGDEDAPRLRGTESRRDLTSAMQRWCSRRVRELEALDLSGYVFKRHSPSCGPRRVKLWPDLDDLPVAGPRSSAKSATTAGRPRPRRAGTGLFARALIEAMPLLPYEDEATLNRPRRQKRFVERVEAYSRWRKLLCAGPTPSSLRALHRAERPLRRRLGGRSERALAALVDQFASKGGRRFLLEYGQLHLDALAGKQHRGRPNAPR